MLLGKESKIESHECNGEGDAQLAVNIHRVNGPHMALEVVCSQKTSGAVMEMSERILEWRVTWVRTTWEDGSHYHTCRRKASHRNAPECD